MKAFLSVFFRPKMQLKSLFLKIHSYIVVYFCCAEQLLCVFQSYSQSMVLSAEIRWHSSITYLLYFLKKSFDFSISY
jgi:hypothetical protein